MDTSSPVAYSSPSRILQEIGRQNKYGNIGIRRLKRYLGGFKSYSVYRSTHENKEKRRYAIHRINQQLEIDLMHIGRHSKFNSNYQWFLACIDIFSKYGYLIPLKDKKTDTVIRALKTILDKLPYLPRGLYMDRGAEFTSNQFKAYLKNIGVEQFFAKQSGHSYQVERFIGSMRALIRAYRIEHNTNTFVNRINDIVNIYNSRIHSTTGLPPKDVTEYNTPAISDKILSKWVYREKRPFKFRLFSFVRIASPKTVFNKYGEKFSAEVFQITSRRHFDSLPIYGVSDLCSGEEIIGNFYQDEITAAPPLFGQSKIKYLAEKEINGVPHVHLSFNTVNNTRCKRWVPKRQIRL